MAVVDAVNAEGSKMGLSDEGEDAVEQRFDDLCLALNMDRHAKEEAWESYQKQRTNYSLEASRRKLGQPFYFPDLRLNPAERSKNC